MSNRRRTKKYIFTLFNLNTEKIDQKYGITIISNIYNNNNENPPDNTTKLIELEELDNSSVEIVSFLDETKRIYKCLISMIDFS